MAKKSTIESEAKAEHESVAEEKREHEGKARGGGVHPTHAGMRSASGGMELNTEGPMPGHDMDKRGGRARRRSGGKTGESDHVKAQEYNAQGSNEMKEAGDETPGFKRGGKKEDHKRRRDGGMAEGEMEKPRLDRRPRRAAGGGLHNPYSSAANFSPPEDRKSARGEEGTPVKD